MIKKEIFATIGISAVTSALVAFGVVSLTSKDKSVSMQFTEDGHLYIPQSVKDKGCPSGLYKAMPDGAVCISILEASSEYTQEMEKAAFDAASSFFPALD